MNTKSEETSQWFRVSPLSVIFYILGIARKIFSQGLPAVIVMFAWIASAEGQKLYWVSLGAGLLIALGLVFSFFSYLRFRYRVSDDRVLLRQGVLHRDELEIEFHRVQNITIKEPFYMRPLGLSVLTIDTAGSGAKEISIAGIQRELALTLRDQILGATKPASGSDSEIPSEATINDDKPRLLLELGRRDVLTYGLTTNFIFWILIAIGAVLGSGDTTETIIARLGANFPFADTLQVLQNEGGTLFVGLAIFGVILLIMLLLPLISVLGALFRYDGYRLSVDGETYRYSSGLLTRFDDSIKQHKIQALVWKQNAIALLFKRITIVLRQVSAGSELENGQLPSASKSNFLVPSLLAGQANELSGEFFPACDPSEAVYSHVDRRRFMVFNMAVLLLPVTLVAFLLSLLFSWLFLLVVPIFAGALFIITNRRWRKEGYGVLGGYGFVRSGFIGTLTTVFPLFKIQRVDVRQTPIQHRKGLAHLTIHLASHSVKVPYIDIEDAYRFRNLALYSAETSDVAWY